jgi:hypothetical protein
VNFVVSSSVVVHVGFDGSQFDGVVLQVYILCVSDAMVVYAQWSSLLYFSYQMNVGCLIYPPGLWQTLGGNAETGEH